MLNLSYWRLYRAVSLMRLRDHIFSTFFNAPHFQPFSRHMRPIKWIFWKIWSVFDIERHWRQLRLCAVYDCLSESMIILKFLASVLDFAFEWYTVGLARDKMLLSHSQMRAGSWLSWGLKKRENRSWVIRGHWVTFVALSFTGQTKSPQLPAI